MTLTHKTLFVAAALMLGAVLSYLAYANLSFAGVVRDENRNVIGHVADYCSNSRAVLGHQVATTIVAASSTRSYMRIEQPINATNTVSYALGTAATIASGAQLTTATTTSPVAFVEMGIATDNPYTGAVSAITNVGSSTVLVTECGFSADTVN